jgi:U3 small nucleolar RNA-associated protein 11
LLEKGKDWKLRRDDFHSKEKRIKALTEKARNRNPDEFYQSMTKERIRNGVHTKHRTAGKTYSGDETKLMSSQDLGYMNMRRSQEQHVRRFCVFLLGVLGVFLLIFFVVVVGLVGVK